MIMKPPGRKSAMAERLEGAGWEGRLRSLGAEWPDLGVVSSA